MARTRGRVCKLALKRRNVQRPVSGRGMTQDVWQTSREGEDARVSGLGDWKRDGVTDRNRSRGRWLFAEFEVTKGKPGGGAAAETPRWHSEHWPRALLYSSQVIRGG